MMKVTLRNGTRSTLILEGGTSLFAAMPHYEAFVAALPTVAAMNSFARSIYPRLVQESANSTLRFNGRGTTERSEDKPASREDAMRFAEESSANGYMPLVNQTPNP